MLNFLICKFRLLAIDAFLTFYLRRFSESRSSSGSTPSVRPYVRPQHFRGTKFVSSVTPKVSFLFIQALPNDCSHIENVHLLLCARFIFFFIFEGCVFVRPQHFRGTKFV